LPQLPSDQDLPTASLSLSSPMAPLITLVTSLALLVGLNLPAHAVRAVADAWKAVEPATQVVDVEVAGFLMTE
jgi:hypothetical protein